MFDPMADIVGYDLIVHALLLLCVVIVPWAIVSMGLGSNIQSPHFVGDDNASQLPQAFRFSELS